MANRYISTSERSKVICQGVCMYGEMMDLPESNLAYQNYKASWDRWILQWGQPMAVIVMDLHEQSFQAAQRF